jgi:hypothetical protein
MQKFFIGILVETTCRSRGGLLRVRRIIPDVSSSNELRDAGPATSSLRWLAESVCISAGVHASALVPRKPDKELESILKFKTDPARARVDAAPSSAIEADTDFSDKLVAAEAVSLLMLNLCVEATSACTSSL